MNYAAAISVDLCSFAGTILLIEAGHVCVCSAGVCLLLKFPAAVADGREDTALSGPYWA